MGAHGMHAAIVEHDDLVRIRNGAHALRDDDLRHAGKRSEARANIGIGRRVHSRGRIVKDEHARPLEQGASNAEALLLPARNVYAALSQVVLEPTGQPVEELVHAGAAACLE